MRASRFLETIDGRQRQRQLRVRFVRAAASTPGIDHGPRPPRRGILSHSVNSHESAGKEITGGFEGRVGGAEVGDSQQVHWRARSQGGEEAGWGGGGSNRLDLVTQV